MKVKIALIFLITLSVLCSCSTYSKYDEESFQNLAWEYGQEVVFNPVIENIDRSYNLSLGIRHMYGLRQDNINVTVQYTSPTGVEEVSRYDFKIKDEVGEYFGSCAGDFCDLESVVNDNINFNELGEYKFVITHNVQIKRISGVMAIGLVLDQN